MTNANLGARSLERLGTCHPDLQRVVHKAAALSPFDFTVLCGLRTNEEQAELYAQGRTNPGRIVTYTDGVMKRSRHQPNAAGQSEAVDLAPFPINWDNTKQFILLASVMLVAAEREGVGLIWGGDWDRDFDLDEHRFSDLPHYELAR